ncbi:GNAT family N-acetyltransferase [Cellulomonas soli]|uniref:GCN5-like N-acetyltransferase n=1 Tax=Cellulomonas soli TaxID=931535 RepID=A0A512PHT1_9CELL|nr:GNAT family N-acetyltransferase [Cellulomonas soli]NYI59265.1 GNAT superfamily N-acetyltransferase [Cellulomonas soli]GEP70769.1 GCN5-like N-acetyltransferase [Cellulomonas soli]
MSAPTPPRDSSDDAGTPRRIPDVIETLTPGDVPAAARVLADALAEDPGYTYLFPSAARRARELDALYRMTLSDAVRHGTVFATRHAGDVTGVVAVYPPGAYPMDARRWWRQSWRLVRLALHAREHSRALARFGDLTSEGVPGDAWYVEAVGVRPDLQRQGRGKALFEAVHGTIDGSGAAAYLETTKPENVGYYRALGYDPVRDRVPLAAGEGPWIVPMQRA